MKAYLAIIIILTFPLICAAETSPLPESVRIGKYPKANVPFDLDSLKTQWQRRISAIKKNGEIPIIDIESSFNTGKVNAKDYA